MCVLLYAYDALLQVLRNDSFSIVRYTVFGFSRARAQGKHAKLVAGGIFLRTFLFGNAPGNSSFFLRPYTRA